MDPRDPSRLRVMERLTTEDFHRSIADATFRVYRRLMRHRERYIRAWLAFARVPPQMLRLVTRGPDWDKAGEYVGFTVEYLPARDRPAPELWDQFVVWLDGAVDGVSLRRDGGMWYVAFRKSYGPKGLAARHFSLNLAAPSLLELWGEVLRARPWTHPEWPASESPR